MENQTTAMADTSANELWYLFVGLALFLVAGGLVMFWQCKKKRDRGLHLLAVDDRSAALAAYNQMAVKHSDFFDEYEGVAAQLDAELSQPLSAAAIRQVRQKFSGQKSYQSFLKTSQRNAVSLEKLQEEIHALLARSPSYEPGMTAAEIRAVCESAQEVFAQFMAVASLYLQKIEQLAVGENLSAGEQVITQ